MAKQQEFSVEDKLKSLIKLQKIDSKIDEVNNLKGELPMEVKDLEDEIEGLRVRENRLEEEINGINQFIDKTKQNIQTAQDTIKKYQKQSDNVKNSREYDALTKELSDQELQVQLYEKHIKDAHEDLEEKVDSLNDVKSAIDAKSETLKEKQAELNTIMADTEKEEKNLSKEDEEARAKVEDRLLFAYDKIRSKHRNGLAVVKIERDSCGGCFNAVPPQTQSEIKLRKKINLCENCGRILTDAELYDSVDE